MSRFMLHLIGSSRPALIEVDVRDMDELTETLMRTRYLRAQMLDEDGMEQGAGALIPTCRVHLVVEAS